MNSASNSPFSCWDGFQLVSDPQRSAASSPAATSSTSVG